MTQVTTSIRPSSPAPTACSIRNVPASGAVRRDFTDCSIALNKPFPPTSRLLCEAFGAVPSAERPSRASEEVPPMQVVANTAESFGGSSPDRCGDRQGGPLRRPALHLHARCSSPRIRPRRHGPRRSALAARCAGCASPAPSSAASRSACGAASSSSTAKWLPCAAGEAARARSPCRHWSTRSPANRRTCLDLASRAGGGGRLLRSPRRCDPACRS